MKATPNPQSPSIGKTFGPVKPNLLKAGATTDSPEDPVNVTRRALRERAVELALINGRSVLEVSKFDWDQARRELTGEPSAKPGETDGNL